MLLEPGAVPILILANLEDLSNGWITSHSIVGFTLLTARFSTSPSTLRLTLLKPASCIITLLEATVSPKKIPSLGVAEKKTSSFGFKAKRTNF